MNSRRSFAFLVAACALGQGCASTMSPTRGAQRSVPRATLETAAKASPESAQVLRDLGWARYFDGDRAEAADAFSRALRIDGDDARARLGLATLADEGGRFGEAREQLLSILERAATPAGTSTVTDPFRPAVQLAAAGSLERLVGESVGELSALDRLSRIDLSRVNPDLGQRIVALRAGLARRHGREDEARRLDAVRGCPASMITTTSYGHLPHRDLTRRFAPEERSPWPAPVGDGLREGVGPLPPPPFQTAMAPARGCVFSVETPQGQPGVAYARTYVRAERGVTAVVAISAEQAFHLIVDGVTIYRHDFLDRYPPRVVALDVPLEAGWHQVLLKIAAQGSRTPMALRLWASPALEQRTDEPAGFAPRPPRPDAARAHHPAGVPQEAAVAQPQLADYLAGIAAIRDGESDAATESVARLVLAAPKFVPGLLLAAQLDEADGSRPNRIARDRARRQLERALTLDPACLAARYELAEMDTQEEHAEKALERLAAAPTSPGAATAPVSSSNASSHAPSHDLAGAGRLVASASPAAPVPAGGVDGWRLEFARYRALKSRGWLLEAERALAAAHAQNPDACFPLVAEAQMASERRDFARARSVATQLVKCAPDSEELAVVEREAGNSAAAAAEYRRLLALDPGRSQLRQSLGAALMAAGDAKGAASALASLVAREPRVAAYRRELADALLAAGDEEGARKTVLAGLSISPESQEMHRALAALGEPGVMDAFRVDGKKVIAAFEAKGAQYESPAVIVLDRTVTRVFSTGARVTLTHNIVRVLTKDGIDKWGEVQIPEGADVLLLRTVKADGSTREPEEIAEKQSTSVPDLEPGDYVEFEYLDPSGAPQAFPKGFFGERFFFQSFDAPLDRTEYVVATPRGMKLQIDRRGAAPNAVLTTRPDAGGLDVRTWSDQKQPQLVAEPQPAPFTEAVPSVRVAAETSFTGWRDFLDEQSHGSLRSNAELRALAQKLKTPEAIDEWVRHHIKQGGSLDDSGTAILARGEGSRVVLERALLAAAGIPSEIWLARPRSGAILDGPLPDLEGYIEPVLAVWPGASSSSSSTGPSTVAVSRMVLDPRFRHAPTGFLAPLLRGTSALSLGDDPARASTAAMASLPGSTQWSGKTAAANPDRRDIKVEATLEADGGADFSVVETLRGWPALEWREGLDRISEDRVRAEFEQHTLGFYFPGSSLTELRFEGKDSDEQPFVVSYKFHTPGYARVEGRELVVPAPYPALLGKRYVGVAERKTPLQLLYAAPTDLRAVMHFPVGARVTPAPAVNASEAFGSFSQESSVTSDHGKPAALEFHARFAMPPERVAAADYQVFRRFAEKVDDAEARAATAELK